MPFSALTSRLPEKIAAETAGCYFAAFLGCLHPRFSYHICDEEVLRDLISDVLPFRRVWYGEPNAISNAVSYVARVREA